MFGEYRTYMIQGHNVMPYYFKTINVNPTISNKIEVGSCPCTKGSLGHTRTKSQSEDKEASKFLKARFITLLETLFTKIYSTNKSCESPLLEITLGASDNKHSHKKQWH